MSGWQTFVTVCDAGSLSAAAHTLGYSQSAVSRQVATLEREVGARLLERLPRGVRPTAAGQALLPHARLVVGELGRARESVRRSAAGGPHVVTLGAVPSATTDLVPRALRLFHERRADQRCLLRSGVSPDLVDRVLTGDLDLAVVTDYPPGLPNTRELERTTLVHDEMGVIVPVGHRLGGRRRRVRLVALADEVWAEDNPGSEQLLVQAAGRAGFEPRVELEAGDLFGQGRPRCRGPRHRARPGSAGAEPAGQRPPAQAGRPADPGRVRRPACRPPPPRGPTPSSTR